MKNIFIYIVSIFMFLGCELDNKGLIDLLNTLKSVDNQAIEKKIVNNSTKEIENSKETVTSSSNEVETTTEETDESNNTLRRAYTKTIEVKPSNWYVRVVVEESLGDMKTQTAQLGQLNKSDAVVTHTLKSMTPYDNIYLDVVFNNPDGVKSGKYKTNFHMYQPEQEDRWTFTVDTDSSHANSDFLLHISGIFVLTPYIDEYNRLRYKERKSMSNPLLKNMKLIDKVSSKEIAVVEDGKTQTYKFNMDNNSSREFELVVQVDDVSIVAKKSRAKLVKKQSVARVIKKSSMKKSESFDLFQPPMIEDMK